MNSRANVFLALAVVGALGPAIGVAVFFAQEGVDLGELVDQAVDNPIAVAVLCDLLISSLVFLTWAWFQAPEIGVRWWPFALANLVGLSFALPLFLYFRERGRSRAGAPAAART